MKNSFCGHCGARLTKGAKFCETCGRPIAESVVETKSASPVGQGKIERQMAGPIKAKKHGVKWVWWLCGGVLVALLAGVAVLVLFFLHRAPAGGAIRLREKDGMQEVYIPAGDFLMGASTQDDQAMDDQFPQHTVNLDGFWIDQHEVTNAQYALCVAAGACSTPQVLGSETRETYYDDPGYAKYPVILISWYQAKAYCEWVEGGLPTEAQWEKAARSTDGRSYPWGNEKPVVDQLNYAHIVGDTSEVCHYPLGNTPYGLCDMAGNVWEYANDWYAADYYDGSPSENPKGPTTGDSKVIRGGSCFTDIYLVSTTARNSSNPNIGYYDDLGFRCVRP
jgi:formylglycine-generating enzyme required for sulfatase activity